MSRKEESKENALSTRAEETAKEYSLGDQAARLTEVGVTRAQALKLAGLGGAGFLFTMLLPADADARGRGSKKKNRRKRRKKNPRKAQVTTPTPVTVVPGAPFNLTITNPSDAREDLIVSGAKIFDSAGNVIATEKLTDPVTIAPGDTAIVPFTVDGPLVDANSLKLFDELGVPITIVDENGATVGDISVITVA